MARAFSEIAFTKTVRALQSIMGSRESYAAFDITPDRRDRLGATEAEFIAERDSFYQATVGETGWPYVQHRGGPKGFLKVLDDKTLGFADFRGNFQFISVGNLQTDDRISLFLMDYTAQRRLKILGRVRVVSEDDGPKAQAAIAALEVPGYRAHVERGFVITVEAYDWNCPQHITPRYTEREWADRQVGAGNTAISPIVPAKTPLNAPPELGNGPLQLEVTGVRQLSHRVRAYELRAPDRSDLPAVSAGSHIDIPIRLPDGSAGVRSYSIASNPGRRDIYEIAVQREDAGRGGSAAIHAQLQLGSVLRCALPRNSFALHDDARPALLIAGGIGITPIKAMAQALQARGSGFALHYIGREAADMPYQDRLARCFGDRYHAHFTRVEGSPKPDLEALIAGAAPDTMVYVCGPIRLIDAVQAAAESAGIPAANVRSERFSAASHSHSGDKPFTVTLTRSQKTLTVAAEHSILETLAHAGVTLPSSCRTGTCGTCVTRVVSGQIDHRDTVIDDTQRLTHMCPCVSRAIGSSLSLDL
ncbi:MAG: pyridoxamine 5'-phosphate oxidase family protein [Rhodocyclaceae bacterium]|nr:pyridoxamine 5'-phosphate oxidase family protein [Rhodocyclaceae bacterium]